MKYVQGCSSSSEEILGLLKMLLHSYPVVGHNFIHVFEDLGIIYWQFKNK